MTLTCATCATQRPLSEEDSRTGSRAVGICQKCNAMRTHLVGTDSRPQPVEIELSRTTKKRS